MSSEPARLRHANPHEHLPAIPCYVGSVLTQSAQLAAVVRYWTGIWGGISGGGGGFGTELGISRDASGFAAVTRPSERFRAVALSAIAPDR